MQLLGYVGNGRRKRCICSIRNSRGIWSREKPSRPGRGEEAQGEGSRIQGRSGPRRKGWKCFSALSMQLRSCLAEMSPPGISSWQVEQEFGSKTSPAGSGL